MKYKNLKSELISLIASGQGHYPDGRIISERQLTDMFNVSRTTVRRAIEDLKHEGYLYSVPGKGTFIKQREQTAPLSSLFRWRQNYIEMGYHPNARILRREIIRASESVAQNLKIETGDSVFLLDKLFFANRMISNESISYFPLKAFPGIENLDFSELSTTDVIRNHYNAQPRKTESALEAVLPSREVAENLQITMATPLILFNAVMSGSLNGQYIPMEYFKSYYKTDRLRLNFTLRHDNE